MFAADAVEQAGKTTSKKKKTKKAPMKVKWNKPNFSKKE